MPVIRMRPVIELHPSHIDTIIAAATMNGCWKELTDHAGVSIVPVDDDTALIHCWTVLSEEHDAWKELLRIIQRTCGEIYEDA